MDKLPHDSHSLGEWVTHREPVNQMPGVGASPLNSSCSGWTGESYLKRSWGKTTLLGRVARRTMRWGLTWEALEAEGTDLTNRLVDGCPGKNHLEEGGLAQNGENQVEVPNWQGGKG